MSEPVLIESKHVTKSTSAWGGLILLIPVVGGMFGASFSASDIEQLTGAVAAGESVYVNLMILIGTIQLIVGRFNARQPVHILPGNTFQIDARTGKRVTPTVKVPSDVAAAMETRDAKTPPSDPSTTGLPERS